MSYITEFPDYDGEFFCPKGWIDASYHNDTCPHIIKRFETETQEIEIRVWQDYEDEEKREDETAKKYSFEIVTSGYALFYAESDYWYEIEKFMKGVRI